MADYSKQLDEIVRLLGRPAVSQWILAAFSVFLGILGATLGRYVEPYLADIYLRKRLRVLYLDMFKLYMSFENTSNPGKRRESLRCNSSSRS